MSDGSRYHRDSLTCAHKSYPLGTMLKVTNLKNKKSVVVKVTDRCGSRRIIDLSYAAAKELGMITAGVAMVRVEKYEEERGIPYRREQRTDLPELDFEISDRDNDYTPEWQMDNKKDANTGTKKDKESKDKKAKEAKDGKAKDSKKHGKKQ